MTRDEIVADLQATVDYAARITELADTFDFETNADVRDALARAKTAIEAAIGMLDGELVRQLEDGDRIYGNERWMRTRKYTERTDHDVIVKAVVNAAAMHEDPFRAAYDAAKAMQSLYVSNSTSAKKGAVDKLSVARDAVFSKDYTGWKVEREPLPDAAQE